MIYHGSLAVSHCDKISKKNWFKERKMVLFWVIPLEYLIQDQLAPLLWVWGGETAIMVTGDGDQVY